jgi:hypothetical protein
VERDVIALLPDEAVASSGRFAQTGRATPGRVVEWIRSLGCAIEADDTKLTIRPMRPVEAFDNRTDRVRLARLLEPFGRRRLPRLTQMADYIKSGRITGILDRVYVRLFSDHIEDAIFNSEMSRASVLILAPYVKDPISDGTMALNLNSHRAAIDAILMSAEMAEQMEREADYSNRTPGRPVQPMKADSDPTEKFIGGLPGEIDAILSAKVHDEFAVFDEANGRMDYVTAWSLTQRTAPASEMTEGRQDVTLDRFKYYPARLSRLMVEIPALKLRAGYLDVFIEEQAAPLTAAQALEIIKARGGAGGG